MKKFKIKKYEIINSKIKNKNGISMVVLADLHGNCFGPQNEDLCQEIKESHPDMILVVGDMNIRHTPDTLKPAAALLRGLAGTCPIFYSLGNHEFQLSLCEEQNRWYQAYERMLTEAGVVFLHNECGSCKIGEDIFWIHGLELPLAYYHKPNPPKLSVKEMKEMVGTPSQKGVHILLAHNPKYGDTYFKWNADIIFSGHYHGGMVRLNENHGLISPYFQIFPSYCCGHFQKNNRHMFVSAGLGEHTIPLRIHNPRELLVVHMKALDK